MNLFIIIHFIPETAGDDLTLATLLTSTPAKNLEDSPPLFPVEAPSPVVSVSSSPEKSDPQLWIPKFNLLMRDKRILESTSWLNDAIIFAAQSLLSLQTMGKVFGWQSTQLSKREGLFKQIPQGPFVQILHISDCHWAVASNVDVHSVGGFHNDVVGIYDSARPSDVGDSVKRMICSFFKCSSDAIHFDLVNIETQQNSYDCGVLAIANATELALGRDPVVCRWDSDRIRRHLKSCLEEGVMKSFPMLGKRRVTLGSRVRRTILERVYCIPVCRMPNDKEKAMISCDKCHGWFHYNCVNLNKEETFSAKNWSCEKCDTFFATLTK